MQKEELIQKLNDCGVKKKDIELRLGMPKNSLSGMLSGSKPIPDKWFVLLEGFLNGSLVDELKPTGIIELKKEPESAVKEEFINSFNVPAELPKPEKKVLPKAKDIVLGADYLADVPKTTFQKLLIEFNLLVEEQPPIKSIEAALAVLIEKSSHTDLNARQSEAIRERCINYLTGQYGKKKQ